MGPMDKFTLPLDPDSLRNTKVVHQKNISETLCKDRMHMLKRYIAKWVYVRGNELTLNYLLSSIFLTLNCFLNSMFLTLSYFLNSMILILNCLLNSRSSFQCHQQ